jgi:periplasmic protein TonB
MSACRARIPEVFSPREIAAAAGLSAVEVERLIGAGRIHTVEGKFVPEAEARRVVRALARGELGADGTGEDLQLLLPPGAGRSAGLPLVVSSTLHAIAIGSIVLLTAVRLDSTAAERRLPPADLQPVRMVYLAEPGPGGGGGGGGLRVQAPPARARLSGQARLSSPVPARRPPPPVRPAEPPREPSVEPLPAAALPIVAPVAALPADDRNQTGVVQAAPALADSRGPGTGGGAGSGEGTGLGAGEGPGIGPGSGGGIGGGPYRPGSGIEPPRLLREVQPDYTDEARRLGITGEVVLEIVVRRDGSVGDIRILQRLDAGLDGRAVQAVRRWRFAPATRAGSPIDVVVEVVVEFRLR